MLPADEHPGIPHHETPVHFLQAAYGNTIEPFTAGPAAYQSWWLHLSLTIVEGIPGIAQAGSRLLVDAFEPGAEEVQAHRSRFLAGRARPDSSRVGLMYAHALSYQLLSPMTLPWPVIYYWSDPVPVEAYRSTVVGPIANGMIANALFEVVTGGHYSALAVEAYTTKEQWKNTFWWRDENWYHYSGLKVPTAHRCAIISARLPEHERTKVITLAESSPRPSRRSWKRSR
jgi:hypothetical protein